MNDNESLPSDGLRLRELVRLARKAFETAGEAREWLRRPHPTLGGASPLECANTRLGAQRVKDILVAIKYGGVV